jgi:hypothetical protein
MAPAAATLRDPYPAAFSPDFHSCETATTTRNTRPSLFSIAKTPPYLPFARNGFVNLHKIRSPACGQPALD